MFNTIKVQPMTIHAITSNDKRRQAKTSVKTGKKRQMQELYNESIKEILRTLCEPWLINKSENAVRSDTMTAM